MNRQNSVTDTRLRPLQAEDLDAVISIDSQHTGRPRRQFFEKRFAAAATRPDGFMHLCIDAGGGPVAFALVRILRGEFGGDEPVAALDVIGVEPDSTGRGYGRAVLHGVARSLSDAGIRSLRSQAEWKNSDLLQFFEDAGFALAPRLVLERSTAIPFYDSIDE